MKNIIITAAELATKAHKGVSRKWHNVPYITHPARVAGRVSVHAIASEWTIAAAYLHDVLEDSEDRKKAERDILDAGFSGITFRLVKELTNPSKDMEDASRAERKQVDRDHLGNVSHEAKVIKLLDRIDNLNELWGAPPHFKKIYVEESVLLLEIIGSADPQLQGEMTGCLERIVF